MGIFAGPEVIEDGLVLALDAANTKGYDKFENIQLYSNSLDVSATPSGYGGGYGQGWMQNPGDITKSNDGYGTYFTTTYSLVWSAYGTCNTSTSTVYTVSFYAKSSTVANIRPRLYSNVNGTVSTGTYQSLQTGGVPDLGDWRKFTFVMPSTTNWGNSLVIELSTGTGFNIKNIQVERGITATEYYPTTTSIKTRGTTWTDLSIGGGNNGTLVNGLTYNSSNRGSIVFDGVDDYITVSNVQPNTNNFTISVWVYKFNNTSNDYIWDFGSNGGTLSAGTSVSGYGFRYYNGTLGTSSNMYTQGTIPDINKWYNVSITRNSGTSTMYVNGSLITSSSGDTHNISSTTLYIGRYGGGTGYEHHGYISNFNIYNRALTATEIQKNFNAQRGRFGI